MTTLTNQVDSEPQRQVEQLVTSVTIDPSVYRRLGLVEENRQVGSGIDYSHDETRQNAHVHELSTDFQSMHDLDSPSQLPRWSRPLYLLPVSLACYTHQFENKRAGARGRLGFPPARRSSPVVRCQRATPRVRDWHRESPPSRCGPPPFRRVWPSPGQGR